MDIEVKVLGDHGAERLQPLVREVNEALGAAVVARWIPGPWEPERLGGAGAILSLALSGGGALTVLLAEIGRWLARTSDLELELSHRGGGKAVVRGTRLKRMRGDELTAEIERLAYALRERSPDAQDTAAPGTDEPAGEDSDGAAPADDVEPSQ